MADSNLPEQVNPDEVTDLILSYNDPNLVSNLLDVFGWSVKTEILETLKIAKQDLNMSAKLKAIQYLRTIIRETAEASGMLRTVSQQVKGDDGSISTFSAKNVMTRLNPSRKRIPNQEKPNVQEEKERQTERSAEDNGGSPGAESAGGSIPEPAAVERGDDTGDSKHRGGDEAERSVSGREHDTSGYGIPIDTQGGCTGDAPRRDDGAGDVPGHIQDEGSGGHPCVQQQPPTCDRNLYPGISGPPGDESNNTAEGS